MVLTIQVAVMHVLHSSAVEGDGPSHMSTDLVSLDRGRECYQCWHLDD